MSPASIKAPHTLPLCLKPIHISSGNNETTTPQNQSTMDGEYSFTLRGNENAPEALRKEILTKLQAVIDEDPSKWNTQYPVQSLKTEGFTLPPLEEVSIISDLSWSSFTANLDHKSSASMSLEPESAACIPDSRVSSKLLNSPSAQIEKTQSTKNHDPSEKLRRRALRKIRNRASAERSRIRKQQGIEKLKDAVKRLHAYNQFLKMSLIQVHTSLLEIAAQTSSAGDPSNHGSSPPFATASELLGQALQKTRYAYHLASDYLLYESCSPRSSPTGPMQGCTSHHKPTDDANKYLPL